MSTRSKAALEGEEKTSPKKKRGRPAKAKAVVEQPKSEDDDTDVDEPLMAPMTGGDDTEKMDVSTESRPPDQSPANTVSTGDQENGLKGVHKIPKKDKTTEDMAEKVTDREKPKDSEVKMKAELGDPLEFKDETEEEVGEVKKEVAVIEEESDPEPEDEVIEDRDDGGEDPSEIEIEKFNMPLEQSLLSDLSDMRCRRRLVVYPLKMSELSHPTLMDAVGLATEFKTSYVKSRVSGSADTMSWIGYMELHMKTTITASDTEHLLKSIREDLNVHILEPGENPQKLVQSSVHQQEFADSDTKLFNSIILARPLPDDATVTTLKTLFPGAIEITFPRQMLGARMAYMIYEDNAAMCDAFDKLSANPPALDGKPLRLMKYDPTVEWPAGLLRLKRRYRVLLQMNRLKKAIKDPQNGRYMDTMKSTVSHCKSLIEKDDTVRKELGFDVPSFAELRQYKRIRESVNEDAIWLPGKRMGGLLDRRSFVDEDEEDERYRRNRRGMVGDLGGIPSLMSVGVDHPGYNPVARAQAIAHQIARMAVAAGPPAMPNRPLLRGPGFGPRGMMRGPRPFRGPMGFPYHGFRGGFHGEGMHDEMMGWRGGRGFGRGGYGRGRGDFHGDDRGYGGGRGRYGDDGYNKRSRSPPSRGGGGGFRGGRDSGGEAPYKMSRGDRDFGSGRGRPDYRGRGSATAGGSRAGGTSRWSKPTSDQSSYSADRQTTATSTAGGYSSSATSGTTAGYSAASTGYNQASSVSAASTGTSTVGYSTAASVSQDSYNYGQQYQQQQQQMAYNTAGATGATTAQGYGQTSYSQQAASGWPTGTAQQQQNTAYMQGYGATAQTGYGQQDASTAYAQQQQNVYAGYTGQQTGTEYYQTAAAYQAAASNAAGQQMTAQQQQQQQAAQAAAQAAWGQQQQYAWPTQQQTAAWPTTDPNAQAQVAADPNAAAAAAAAYAAAYNWPGWK